MKSVKLVSGEKFNSKQVLEQVVSLAKDGVGINEMRMRMRILDALEATTDDELKIEDFDYQLLLNLTRAFPFAFAHRDFLLIVDAVESAE